MKTAQPIRTLADGLSDALWTGTLFAVCLSFWLPCDSIQVNDGTVLSQVAIWLLLALFYAIVQWKFPSRPNQDALLDLRLTLPFAAFLGWVWLSAWATQSEGDIAAALHASWQYTSLAIGFALLTHQAHSSERRNTLLLLMGLLTLTAAFHGLYQYFVSLPETRAIYEANPERLLREQGISTAPGSMQRMQFENRLYSTEPFGPFALANSLAGILVPTLILNLAWLPTLRRRGWVWLASGILSLAIIALCLALTKSRAAWISSLVAIVFLMVTHSPWRATWMRWRWKFAIGGGVLLVSMLLFLLWVDPLVLTETPKSLRFRFQYWISSILLIKQHPWIGVGPGNFQSAYPAVKLIEASETVADPHSFWIELATTCGLPALILLAVSIIQWFRKVDWNEEHGTKESNSSTLTAFRSLPLIIGMVIASGIVWGVPGLIGNPPEALPYGVSIILLLGMIVGWARWKHQQPVVASTRDQEWFTNTTLLAALIGTCLHLCGSGGWLAPGCMAPILILLATMRIDDNRSSRMESTPMASGAIRHVPLAYIGLSVLAVIAFALGTWKPYMAVMQWRYLAPLANSLERAKASLDEVERIAPHYPEIGQQRVAIEWESLRSRLGRGNSVDATSLEAAIKNWIAKNPRDWNAHRIAGDVYFELAAHDPRFLVNAQEHYEAAISKHPSEPWLPLQASVAAWFAQDLPRARAWLDRAESLDEATPHWDHKLGMARVLWPTWTNVPAGKEKLKIRPASDPASPPDNCEGEPARKLLRTLLDKDSETDGKPDSIQ